MEVNLEELGGSVVAVLQRGHRERWPTSSFGAPRPCEPSDPPCQAARQASDCQTVRLVVIVLSFGALCGLSNAGYA